MLQIHSGLNVIPLMYYFWQNATLQ